MRTLAKRKRLVRLLRETHLEHGNRYVDDGLGYATGLVYFLGAGKYIKIGYTTRPLEERIAALQTGCPFPIRVLATIPGDNILERDFHRMFGPWRTNGEWFRAAAPGLRQLIAELDGRLL